MKILSVWPLPLKIKTLLPLLFAISCILVGGCASPDFTPYVGEQDWPQGTGCTIKTNCIVPIYYGWPDKPYTVLGVITMSGINNAAVARCAKSKGADALIFRNVLTEDAGTYTSPGYATSYTSGSYIGDQYSGLTTTTYHPGVSIPLTVTVSVYDAIKWEAPSQTPIPAVEIPNNGLDATSAQNAESLNALEALAEQGNSEAQDMLGRVYSNGLLGVPENWVEAAKWYQKAAEQGNADAQSSLGSCYENGLGLPKNYVEAVKWYGKAAEQGDSYAQTGLGSCYELGEGLPQDYNEAVKWFRKAAEQGYPIAELSLGVCYATGQGVAKDHVEAYKWLNLALAHNIPTDRERLSAIENEMTPSQIAEGQRRSAAFVPSNGNAN